MHIGEYFPRFTQFGHAIDEIAIEDRRTETDVKIASNILHLSRGLVAIIGGKGSGKTALLDLIANNFENRTYDALEKHKSEQAVSFVARNTKRRESNSIETILLFQNGEEYAKRMDDGPSIHSSNITYLSQGKLEDYSGDSKKLQSKIREVIFSKIRVSEPHLAIEYDGIRQEINSCNERINVVTAEIKNAYHKIKQLDSARLLSIKTEKDQSIQAIDREISNLLSVSEGSASKFHELVEKQQYLSVAHQKLVKIDKDLTNLSSRISIVERDNSLISSINREIASLDLSSPIENLNTDMIQQSIAIIKENISSKQNVLSQHHIQIKNEIEGLSLHKQQIEDLQIKRESEDLILQKANGDLNFLVELYSDIESLRREQSKNLSNYIQNFMEIQINYDKIINKYGEYMPDILKGIGFEAEVRIGYDLWSENIFSSIDSRKKIGIDDIRSDLCKVTLENHTDEVVHKALSSMLSFASQLKKSKDAQDLETIFYSMPITLTTSIKYNGTTMENLSMGQRGTVLLNIYLADGENTLIIDQPEENLDNK